MPAHTRTVCLEFFGQARDAVPSIVEIKRYLDVRPAKARGAILAGLEHLDERYLRAVGYSHQVQARRAAEDGAARRHRRRGRSRGGARHLRGGAHRQCALGRGLHRRQRRGAQEVLARSRARPRPSPSTPTRSRSTRTWSFRSSAGRVHRRHRAHQHRAVDPQQARAARRAGGVFSGASLRCRWGDERRPRTSGARSCSTACARAGVLLGALRRCRRARGCTRRAGDSATPQEPRALVLSTAAGPQHRRRWKTQKCAPLRASSSARRSRPCSPSATRCTSGAAGRVFVALHMHAGDGNVHTNIPVNSDNYAMLQTANRAVARIMASRAAERRDLRRARHRHHQARVPDRRELADFRAYKQRVDPDGPLQQGQADAGRATCAAPTRRASACWATNR
jgi:FAD/FMN-containing dehydrogenase